VPTGATPVNQFPKQQAESSEIGRSQAPFDRRVAGRLIRNQVRRADIPSTPPGRRRTATTTPDLNQLTIAGHVERAPEMQDHDDCDTVCRFRLSPTRASSSTGAWTANTARHSPATQPIASIIADNIITLHDLAENVSRTESVSA
jgi:hypothetical protein